MADISIIETIVDKQSDYNIKRYNFAGRLIERPIKTIDAKIVTAELIKENQGEFNKAGGITFFETAKYFTSNAVSDLLIERDNNKIKDKFGATKILNEGAHFIVPTFKFNPYKEFTSFTDISGFFDYYYTHSNTALFVPNINVWKNRYEPVITRTGKTRDKLVDPEIIMKFEDYLKFVKEAHDYLNTRNNKPIFVPISLKFNMEEIVKLAEFYIKNEYFYTWVDFQGTPSANRANTAKLRKFRTICDKNERFKEMLMHSTNVRREITSNPNEPNTAASDVLTSVIGSNIVGVNREPSPPVPKEGEERKKVTYEEMKRQKEHKARILNSITYYYEKISDKKEMAKEERENLMQIGNNIIYNAIVIDKEFIKQKLNFIKTHTIRPYIEKKKMIKAYEKGNLKKHLFIETTLESFERDAI
jgi:hypothetical protein